MFVEVALFCIVIALLFGYWNVNQIYAIWLKCNIPFEKAQFPYGNIKDVGKTKHIFELTRDLYNKMKKEAPVAGFHVLTNAAVVITDLDIVRKVLVTDSHLFMDRGMYVNLAEDPLSGHIFNLDGPKYKEIHSKLMPLFSPDKVKSMFQTMDMLANRLSDHFADIIDGPTDCNFKDILSRYSVDVMGTIFLGIDCDSLNNENGDLEQISKKYLIKGRERGLKYFFRNTFQETALRLKRTETLKPVSDFFIPTIKATINNRKSTNSNDLVDLLKQHLNGKTNDEKLGGITVDDVISQAYYFYTAGFETISTTLTLCLYEMCKARDLQENLRRQIREVFPHGSAQPNCDTVNDIPYLDQIINETLRKHPSVPVVFRSATTDYKLPDSNMVIPTGTQIMIPIYAIHHDEDIYPKPETFNPERFNKETMKIEHPCSFIPFSCGPRACMGSKFAVMNIKVTLINLLRRYRFSIGSKTPFPLKFDKKSYILCADDVWLTVENVK